MSQYPPPPPGYPQQPPQGYPPQYGQYPQQYPPQYAPLPYGGIPPTPPSPRPTSVTVVAILAIIFGSLGVLAMLCTLPQYMGMMNFGGPNPVRDAMRADKLLWGYTMGSMVVGLVISALQLFGGIGALSLKQAARGILNLYAWLRIAVGAIELVVSVAIIQPKTMAIVQQSMGKSPAMNQPGMREMMKFGQYAGVAMGVIFLVWPIIVLYVMSRPHVKAAFQRGWVEGVPPGTGQMMPPQQQPPMPPPYA